MQLWDRIDQVARRHDVLRHPFYVRWSEGTLARADLACYAGQYRHAVVALADAAASAARSPEAGDDASQLSAHAAAEADHVRLWDEFTRAVGGERRADPTPETRVCVSTWTGDGSRSLVDTLATMYAIESAQPEISRIKRHGLTGHYGVAETGYFTLHEGLDAEHAAQARELIEVRRDGAGDDQLVAAAERALEANWILLDGVDRLIAEAAPA